MTVSPARPPLGRPLPDNTPPDIVAFYRYWVSLPKVDLRPTLSDYFDHAPSALQPFVAFSDIYSPTKIIMRLMGTGLVDAAGRDPTGKEMNALYSEKLLGRVGMMAHTAVTHPVGYLCIRTVRLKDGNLIHCPSICLPAAHTTNTVPALITYARVVGAEISFNNQNTMEMVHDLRMTAWIDIGAGVPERLVTG